MDTLFKWIEKALLFLCLAGTVVCLVAGFSKPHCFIMAFFYGVLSGVLGRCVAENKED